MDFVSGNSERVYPRIIYYSGVRDIGSGQVIRGAWVDRSVN